MESTVIAFAEVAELTKEIPAKAGNNEVSITIVLGLFGVVVVKLTPVIGVVIETAAVEVRLIFTRAEATFE